MSNRGNNSSPQRGTNASNNNNGNPITRDANAVTRVTLALKLRAAKYTYEQIAAQAGYNNASAARKAIMRELDRVVVHNVNELRQEELLTLDILQQECYKRMMNKEHEKAMLFAVDRILAIQERRAKLMGLDTPVDSNIAANMVVIREMPQGYLGITEEKKA